MPLQTETLPSWSRDDDLIAALRIENERAAEPPPVSFTPRSITERAAALGGHASVKQREDTTIVIVAKIPL